jgi:hypothetical protein
VNWDGTFLEDHFRHIKSAFSTQRSSETRLLSKVQLLGVLLKDLANKHSQTKIFLIVDRVDEFGALAKKIISDISRFMFDSDATKDLKIKCYMTANWTWSNTWDLDHLMDDYGRHGFRSKMGFSDLTSWIFEGKWRIRMR